MNVSRLLFAITVLLTYPIECFVCREVLLNTLWPNELEQRRSSLNWHIILTTGLVLFSYVCSLFTDCLGVVLELNVSLFSKFSYI